MNAAKAAGTFSAKMKTYNASGRYRLEAEWERPCKMLMSLPAEHTDWAYMLGQAQDQCLRLVRAMLDAGQRVLLLVPPHHRGELPAHPLLQTVEVEYNDTWTRDYGPLTVRRSDGTLRLLDFGFNAWGLKFAADRDNLVTLRLEEGGVLTDVRNCRDFILEGGSIDTDGLGTILTTTRCLCSPNRNGGKGKAELNDLLHQYLGADHVLWLDFGALEGDDTDSHIDTLARMAPHDTLLYISDDGEQGAQGEELRLMARQLRSFRTAEGHPFNLVELPLPDPVYDDDGSRLPATYANYLITPTHIFVPTYAQPMKDELAVRTLHSVFPGHIPVPVDCRAYLRQHGSLHCATMQLPTY